MGRCCLHQATGPRFPPEPCESASPERCAKGPTSERFLLWPAVCSGRGPAVCWRRGEPAAGWQLRARQECQRHSTSPVSSKPAPDSLAGRGKCPSVATANGESGARRLTLERLRTGVKTAEG